MGRIHIMHLCPLTDLYGTPGALLIQHCYSPFRTTQLVKTVKNRQKGHVLAIKGPFGDLGGPRRAPGDQIWSQLPPIGLPGLDSWSPLTLTWYWVPSGPPGAQKGPILAQISMAPFLWDIFCVRNIALWGVQSITTERPAHPALLQPIWNHPA